MRVVLFAGSAIVLGAALAACGGDASVDSGDDAGGQDADPGGDSSVTDAGGTEVSTPCAADTISDPNNCGSCGHACSAGFSCSAGHCANEVIEVGAGTTFACVVLGEGSVYCWGNTDYGQLGFEPSAADDRCGPSGCRATPAKIPGLTNVTHISLGGSTACAVDTLGTVKCWGRNDVGECAQPTATDHFATPVAVSFPPATEILDLTTGENTACARSKNKDVYCWGANTNEEVGVTASTSVILPVLAGDGLFNHDVRMVRMGFDADSGQHACVLRDDATVWCWGKSEAGEIGLPPGGAGTKTPNKITNLATPTSIAVGPATSCAVDTNVYCWGSDLFGERGAPATGSSTATPVQVAGVAGTISSLTIGKWSQFAVTQTGSVFAWGSVNWGALGNGVYEDTMCAGLECASAVETVSGLTNIAQISSANGFGLALTNDGKVLSWGTNDLATLGHLPNAPGSGDKDCLGKTCNPLPKIVTDLP